MAWIDDGAGSWQWQPDQQNAEPTTNAPTTPPPSSGKSPSAAKQATVQTANNQALTRSVTDPSSPNYRGPGYSYSTGPDGAVHAVLTDPAANAVWQATKGPNATAAPVTNPSATIDPATGKPLGQAPAAAPRTGLQTAQAAAGAVTRPTAPNAAPGAPRRAVDAGAAGARPASAVAGVQQPSAAPAAPGAPAPYQPLQADYSRYDQATQALDQARNTFQSELSRLSGVDPFGNQAFLQKATDRAVAQASGTAAMARGGAAALAGANRTAQGVQAQATARGTQEMAQTRAQDEMAAGQLRLGAASGIADLAKQRTENEVALGDQAVRVGTANLQAAMQQYGIDANIGQAEKESLRNLGVAMANVDMERYKTDVGYRESVDQGIIQKYVSNNALQGVLAQIEAQEGISGGEALMGLLGAAAGVGQGFAMKSDRRSKYAVRAPKLAELREFLSTSGGAHYRYRSPNAPGQRAGENFGPMAQDLRKSKIGRTVVVEKADGLYVDAARLALADHGALSALSKQVERLARRLEKKK